VQLSARARVAPRSPSRRPTEPSRVSSPSPNRGYLLLRLPIGGGPGRNPQAHPALARQRGDRGVGGVEELLDLIRERGLPDAGEVEGLGDDGTLAAGPDQGLERRLEHALHLRGHPRQRGEQRPLPLHERPHRRPYRIGDELSTLGKEGLLVVVGGWCAAEPGEHGVHVFPGLLILDHLASR
jgi:hypothetical protein